jgi:hypothetical protein
MENDADIRFNWAVGCPLTNSLNVILALNIAGLPDLKGY